MTENQKLREALQLIAWSNDSKWQADCARQALALSTADHLPDAGEKVEAAAPVGERERFEKWASREGYLTTFEPNAMCSKGLPVYKDPRTHAAWWAWQARAALIAGDAVDAQRYRWLMDNCTLGIKQNGVGWSLNTSACVAPDCIKDVGAAIDATMRKDKL